MERDERRRADELDHYWNAVTTGEPPPQPSSVDAVMARVIAIVSERQSSPDLDVMRQRVRQQFLSSAITDGIEPLEVRSVAMRSRTPEEERRHVVARSLPAVLAIAVALVTVVGIGSLVFDPLRSLRQNRHTIPAAFGLATPDPAMPTPAARDATIVRVDIPAEVLATASAGESLAHFSIPSGVETTWSAYQNAMLVYLWQGTLSVTAETDVRIQHVGATGSWEIVPAGRAVDLEPGEAMLLLDLTRASFSNGGTISVELVSWGISSEPTPGSPAPAEWVPHDYALSGDPGSAGIALRGKAGQLRLDRVVFEAGGVLPAPTRDVLQWVIVRVRAETLEVYQGTTLLLTIPRLLGERQHRIDYRHISASLVRKPGAFAQYRYRDDLFPTLVFRQAYDALMHAVPHRADRDDVRLLHLAAGTSEAAVEAVIAERLGQRHMPIFDLVRDRLRLPTPAPLPELTAAVLDFGIYDELLTGEVRRG